MKHYHSKLDAAAVKAAVDPTDFYLREQNLYRFGYTTGVWAVAGHCPFHDDAKAGSFKINQDSGAFKCFSCEAAGGDVIAFLQKRDGLNFVDALRVLADEWGCA